MTYEEFCSHFDKAFAEAERLYGDEGRSKPMIISEGMDAECEKFILSPGYVTGPIDESIFRD